MSLPANVTSIEALHTLRVALIRFAEEATGVVDGWRQEVLRTLEWVDIDRPGYWKEQVRRSFDSVAQARSQLEIARRRAFDGQGPSCIEEKVALQNAQRRLQFSQDQIHVVRNWAIKLQQESDDYRSLIGHLESFIKSDLPRAIARLERMLEALDRYSETTSSSAPNIAADVSNNPPTSSKQKNGLEAKTDQTER